MLSQKEKVEADLRQLNPIHRELSLLYIRTNQGFFS